MATGLFRQNLFKPVWPIYQVNNSSGTYIFFVQRASEDYSVVDHMAAFIKPEPEPEESSENLKAMAKHGVRLKDIQAQEASNFLHRRGRKPLHIVKKNVSVCVQKLL